MGKGSANLIHIGCPSREGHADQALVKFAPDAQRWVGSLEGVAALSQESYT